MKKFNMLLLALLAAISLSLPKLSVAAKSLDEIKEAGEIVLGTNAEYPPFEWVEMKDGEQDFVGIDFDLAQLIADEIGVDQDKYIEALKKVKVSNMEAIKAGADMLGDIITQMVSSAYYEKNSDIAMHKLDEVEACFNEIFSTVSNLSQIERNQKILALNASIEAARAGEHGRGFAIVAKKVETLASDIGNYNSEITGKLNKLAELMKQITQGK